MTQKQILYVDMDGVLVDFRSGLERIDPDILAEYADRVDEIPGVFALMAPMPDALEAFAILSAAYDTYILSTASWLNPSAWSDKIEWVHRHLGSDDDSLGHKRLILSHNKHLNVGSILIDDRPHNGAAEFTGQWLQFGSKAFPDWAAILDYLPQTGNWRDSPRAD